MKIIGLITTKDRLKLFERALQSAHGQTRKLDSLIVVGDSLPENEQTEKQLAIQYGAQFIKNRYAHNYAGSLNSAIHYILKNDIFAETDYDNTYVAILDDDDVWLPCYLEECEKALHGEDFVVSGLIYCKDGGYKKGLSLPDDLTIDSFLKGNPHIQGSNTFVKFSALLRAGLFDENMSSTTDRDIFTRIMLLNPTYTVCKKYLVEIDAGNSRERITNSKQKKADGLRKFYYKYNGYMSEQVKQAFFERAQNLFEIDKTEIEDISSSTTNITRNFSTESYNGNLTIGFIATEYELGLRLLGQLVALQRKNTKIVIFINFINDRTPYLDLLKDSGCEYEIIDRKCVLARIENGGFDQFVTEDKLGNEIVKSVAVSRTILQKYLYELTCDGDVIWVLDEDMEIKELVYKEEVEKISLDVDKIIATYKGEYDAVVGGYALDAPLPTLSTLRTSLLDFVYNRTAKIGEISTLATYADYYYDLSDYGNAHLETPVKIKNSCTLDDIFCGKAQGRPLFIFSSAVQEAKNRGGNTLIFNRLLLTIPNWSIQIGDKIGRRSDYFWVWQAKQQGYKIAGVPFATFHNRNTCAINLKKEEEKLLLDIIGSSFVKAVEAVGIDANKEDFFKAYSENFINRLVKYAASFYRVNGLLSIIGDNKYLSLFSFGNLKAFLHYAENYVQQDAVVPAYKSIQQKLQIQTKMSDNDLIQAKIGKMFNLPEGALRLLGNGGEGVVFTDESYVYKYFFVSLDNIDFLKKVSEFFRLNEHFYPLDFFETDGTTLIRYPYEKSEPYKNGYVREFADFLRFAKKNGFVFDNYKKSNFIIANGKLKLIDYGKSFLPYSEELHNKSIKRVYEMLRYPFLSEDEFRQIIHRYYQNDTEFIDDGCELFAAIVNCRYKEDLHDDIVLGLVDEYEPKNILDYGAGKCKLANALSSRHNVAVFDVDTETIKSRALPNVKIYDNAEEIPPQEYDVILNNLVLCCVENETAEEIVRNIVRALKKSGHVVLSICNPFFNNVQNTELRTNGLHGNYEHAEMYVKHTTVGSPVRKEYHRPIEYYLNLFERNGLRLKHICEGRGANIDTLLPIAEHLVFVLEKDESRIYTDCSLMIKTNPMEHNIIYRNIRNIVTTLEKGGRFEKRIVVADFTKTEKRPRRYDADDARMLKLELDRAKMNGLVDEIIYAEDKPEKIRTVYKKYFGIDNVCGHSANGQGLYATLLGFESVATKYVFQTDSDIIYYNKGNGVFLEGLKAISSGAVTATIGIASEKSDKEIYGTRTEVRTSFINLQNLKNLLPLPNSVENGCLQLTWHRALDKILNAQESIRLKNKDLWFVHPENVQKQESNFISYVERRIACGQVMPAQYDKVNLQGDKKVWIQTTKADVVIYIRGYNTSCEKLKRMFDSLKKQTYQDFEIVYLDDASENESAEYAAFILEYDKYFADKKIMFLNDMNVGTLENFIFVMQNVIKNPNTIVINLDNDDYLVNNRAVEIIVRTFSDGAEITCGNCLRYDRPLKRYQIKSFEKVWKRGGDNIWLHPKSFKRYLFDFIDINADLKINGKLVDVNTDFAFMLPMIRGAKKKVFIDEVLYYFEPSVDNVVKKGKYNYDHKTEIREKLLQKEKKLSENKE